MDDRCSRIAFVFGDRFLQQKSSMTCNPTAGPMHKWSPPGRGFTLVELLVVISIIAILIALLLPAVQAARESARLIHCRNNLKQLAIAWFNFEAAHQMYPGGGWYYGVVGDADCGVGRMQPGGWIFRLLPYLEQGALHDMGQGLTHPDNWQEKLYAHGRRYVIPVPTLSCPTRRDSRMVEVGCCIPGNVHFDTPGGVAPGQTRTDYAANLGDGPMTAENILGEMPTGVTLMCFEFEEPHPSTWPSPVVVTDGLLIRDWNGVSHSGSRITAAAMRDGTSNTYMVGEKHVDPLTYYAGHDWGDDWGLFTGQQDDNYRICFKNMLNDNDPLRPSITPVHDTSGTGTISRYSLSFGSAHPAGLNMALCDGSVHFISYSIDGLVHSRLANRHDGHGLNPNDW